MEWENRMLSLSQSPNELDVAVANAFVSITKETAENFTRSHIFVFKLLFWISSFDFANGTVTYLAETFPGIAKPFYRFRKN